MPVPLIDRMVDYERAVLPSRRLPVTADGLQELVTEIRSLEAMREEAMAELKAAADGEPERRRSTLDEVMALDREIEDLRQAVARCVTVPADEQAVAVGTVVTLLGDEGARDVALVGPMAANAVRGRISFASPLARAVLGHRAGEEVDVVSSDGASRLKIVAVRPTQHDTG